MGLGDDGLEAKSIGWGLAPRTLEFQNCPKLQLQGSLWPLTSVGTAHTDTVHACAPKGWEVKARLEVQGQPWLTRHFQAHLAYMINSNNDY